MRQEDPKEHEDKQESNTDKQAEYGTVEDESRYLNTLPDQWLPSKETYSTTGAAMRAK